MRLDNKLKIAAFDTAMKSLLKNKNKYPDLIEKINVEIENMKKDGTFDKILEKYDLK